MAIEGVEDRDRECGVGEGDGLITEIADAGGVVSGVEISCSASESGDGIGVNGAGCVVVEGVEDRDREGCLLYTSPSPRDGLLSRMPSSA